MKEDSGKPRKNARKEASDALLRLGKRLLKRFVQRLVQRLVGSPKSRF